MTDSESDKTYYCDVNEYGDVECPQCDIAIITPPRMELCAGIATCPFCELQFVLTDEMASLANDRAELQHNILYGIVRRITLPAPHWEPTA